MSRLIQYPAGKEEKDFIIPESVTEIGSDAFFDCSGLTSVTIPNSVTEIAYGAFFGCSGLTSVVIPNSVTEIGEYAFSGCSGLTSVTIPNSFTSIGFSAFSYCRGLTSVIIPPSVEYIGDGAFRDCSGLTTIIMGAGVKRIGNKTFYGCPAENVYISAHTPPEIGAYTFDSYTANLWLQDPGDNTVINAYQHADYWQNFGRNTMVNATDISVNGETVVNGKPGDEIQLYATVAPADATLPHIFWRSTNPDVATVDHNGLVTLLAPSSSNERAVGEPCKIIAETLYADGPTAEFAVNSSGSTDIEKITVESGSATADGPTEVYNLRGVKVGESTEGLPKGIYIIREGNKTRKFAI